MQNINYKSHLDYIRIIAVVLVIVNHVDINYYFYHDTTSSITFIISLLTTIICQIDVPLFFMISGALLLSKEESLKAIWTRRIPRILSVLVIFSLVQYLIFILRGKITDYNVYDFIKRLLSGDIQEPYWFLYYYLGFLIILPVLRSIAKNISDDIFIYLFAIRLVLDFIIPLISYLTDISICSHLSDPLNMIGSNLVYFLAGYYVDNRIAVNKNGFVKCLILAIVFVVAPCGYVFFYYINDGSIYDTIITRVVFVITLSSYYIFKFLFQNIDNTFIKKLGNCVFGVYLIESMVRMIYLGLYKYLIQVAPGVVGAFVYIVLTAVTAFVLVYIYKEILRLVSKCV